MNYRSVNDMDQIIREKISIIPKDVELIVGVPRSGMLPATLLSVYLNLPLTDSVSILSGNSHATVTRNDRQKSGKNSTDIRDYKKILVIDDSCYTGGSIEEVRQAISAIPDCDTEVLYACVYVLPQMTSVVDIYFEKVPAPRVFEWNLMNNSVINAACVDIDGVLCVDPTEEQNDDGEKYIDFLLNTKPLWIPTFKIGALVTSRLEKYREYTEKWLADHNVKYDNLVMLDLKTREERMRLGAHGPFKAAVYERCEGAKLFIESDPGQARQIYEITKMPVYCVSTNEFFGAEDSKALTEENRKEVEDYIRDMSSLVGKLNPLTEKFKRGEYDENLMNIVIESWDQILEDMKNMFPLSAFSELDRVINNAHVFLSEKNYGGFTAAAENMPRLCMEALNKELEAFM